MNPSRVRPDALLAALCLSLLGAPAPVQADAAPAGGEATVPVAPGAALRAAVEAMEAGDEANALALLEGVAVSHPVVADYADRLRIETLARGDDPAATAEAARLAVARHPKSPLAPQLQMALGEALLAVGDEEGARAAWELALEQTDRKAERTRITAALGETHFRAGRHEAAGKAYLDIWRRDPLSPQGDQAEVRLREIEQELGRSLRTGLDARTRGDALRSAGQNEMAILAYDRALGVGDLKPRDRRRTLRSRAQSLFAIRRYTEATQAFTDLAPDPDSAVSRARSIARSGDVPTAIAELEAIAGGRWGRTSVYARYIAALLLEDEDELLRARRHFAKVAGNSDHPRYANPSLWYLGWTAWRQGDAADARDQFQSLAGRLASDPIGQLRARYWAARAGEKLGEADAQPAFEAIAREFPISYYGWRSSGRVPLPEPEESPADPPVAELPELAETTRPPIEPGTRTLKPADLARGRILLEAGLNADATRELSRAAERAGGVEDRVEVARLLADAGEYHRAQSLVVRHYRTDLARGVVAGQEDLWWLAWPEAYGELVLELSPEGPPLRPEIVSAVMREESGYRPAVTSPAGARGLLQIMPETGHRLARQLGLRRFDPDDLYRPRVNIQLGAFYLQQLATQFDGRMEAAIASYNAGPNAATRWTEEHPGLADDEWVEAVPYSQTRAYVKRVLRSVHAYRVLY
ncbi:MAG: transglycosylase SLT domain-containing protein [Deltaproteobacteria bacterium]|nr:transglycosylase SLT domain-containing protein [Deltaproteobacteria bacterium]